MIELLALADIPAVTFGEAPRARRGETFTVADDEGVSLIEAGLVVKADSADAAFFRNARAFLAGKNDG